jgi:nicotinamidase-related amidase
VARLKKRAKAQGIPAIYVNDNFGRWRSDFPHLVKRCLENEVRGEPIVAQLQPEPDDYFVLKPRHSAFYQTALESLLGYLGATTLILTGMAADICVLFSANDAYMRGFRLFVPADCIASETGERSREALQLMQRVLKADISVSTTLALAAMTANMNESELNLAPR